MAAQAVIASGRDIRLDLFRGLALWFIFVDHVPANVVSWLTVRNYGFSDATEIFVFISGYTAVIAYARMMRREGWLRAAARIWRRVWQLYVAHILLFVAFTAQIVWASVARDMPSLIEEMELMGLGDNPYQAILAAALLQFRPVNLDVLPLYIVLLAAFPFVLPVVVRRPFAVIAASLLLYAATCRFGWNLPAYPENKVGTSIPWPGRWSSMSARRWPSWRRGLPRSTDGACRFPSWPCSTCCSRPRSPCHGTTIRWSA
jgi:hypothetical protein